ncbi:MAG: helix-turn-helix domain-containing protein [Pseudomonadota bacterium]
MARTIDIFSLSPETLLQAQALGSRIRMARQRRGLRVEDVAEKARIGKKTVEAVEKGALTTSLGAYLAVLNCMSLGSEVDLVADPGLDREGALLIYEPGTRRVRPSRKLDNDF